MPYYISTIEIDKEHPKIRTIIYSLVEDLFYSQVSFQSIIDNKKNSLFTLKSIGKLLCLPMIPNYTLEHAVIILHVFKVRFNFILNSYQTIHILFEDAESNVIIKTRDIEQVKFPLVNNYSTLGSLIEKSDDDVLFSILNELLAESFNTILSFIPKNIQKICIRKLLISEHYCRFFPKDTDYWDDKPSDNCCIICCNDDNPIHFPLSCGHFIHRVCMVKSIKNKKPICPVCRQTITVSSAESYILGLNHREKNNDDIINLFRDQLNHIWNLHQPFININYIMDYMNYVFLGGSNEHAELIYNFIMSHENDNHHMYQEIRIIAQALIAVSRLRLN
jgi:hypothetical protein